MAECKDCIHFEVCAYASHELPPCSCYSFAEKERHGRWINKQGGFWETATCSNCAERFPTVGIIPNYCPNCGAKMDGGEGND